MARVQERHPVALNRYIPGTASSPFIKEFPMSSEGFDQREMLGIDAALNRCRTLVARIEDALKKDTPLRDTVAIAEVHAALNRAAELLDLGNEKQSGSAASS
jgi:hypothetical protein